MTLRKWLESTKITVKAFAQLIKIDRSYAHMILKGYLPSYKIMKRINEVTMGNVDNLGDLKDGKTDSDSK